MRHLEIVDVQINDPTNHMFDIKVEDFNDLASNVDLKEEIADINLEDCEPFMKDEFNHTSVSNVQDTLENVLNIGIGTENELIGLTEFNAKSKRKNKRKAHPQKAVKQKQENLMGSTSDNLEASERFLIDDHAISFDADNLSDSLINSELFNSDSDLPESEEILKDIDEDNIFQALQEEVGNKEREEFKANWGVKCNRCKKLFTQKADFDKHYTSSYNMNPVYTCAFCNKTVDKYSTFRSHCYRHITEGRYKCSNCPKSYCLQSLLQEHVMSKHSKEKPFTCQECGKSFMTQAGLKMHLGKHRGDAKEEYPCVVCGKVLHTRGGLTSHMNVHRLGRRFMCDVCGKTFTQKVNMQQHAKQHTGDKPHRCDKCGKQFAEKSHLARHYSFHSDKRPYKCEVCEKMYKTERCLKVHSMVHADARPFVCTYCNKGFLSSTKLKQHHNVHTGERPFECKYCKRTFTNYPNWLKHVRRTHKVDHKTGKNLDPQSEKRSVQVAKVEETSSLSNISVDGVPSVSVIQPTLSQALTSSVPVETPTELAPDLMLSRSEEMLLQQTLLQYPVVEDKYIYQQQLDMFNGNSNGTMGVYIPYLQPSVQQVSNTSNASNVLPPLTMQLGDIMTQIFQPQPMTAQPPSHL